MAHNGNGIHGGALSGLPISPETARKLRTDAGLSMATVGRRINATNSTVMYWEEGRHAPVGDNRARYIHVLHALAGFLLELTGSDEYAAARAELAGELGGEREPAAA